MNVKDINTAIVTGSFTNTDLDSIMDAVKFAKSRIAMTAKHATNIGHAG